MHMSSHEQQSRGANLHHRWRNLTSTRILKGCNTMVSRMAVGRGPVVTKNLGRVSVSARPSPKTKFPIGLSTVLGAKQGHDAVRLGVKVVGENDE
jgi:hypothetical protein